VAVLKVDSKGKPLPALRIGTSHDLLVGQKAFAIGNPFGLEQSLTTGIISGLNREMTSIAGTILHGVIQTDAAINPGNSGGPLLDSSGRVIGMNTSITSPSGASAGIGFAIPADTLNTIVPQIIRTGRAQHAGIGIAKMTDVHSPDGRVRGVVFQEFAPTSVAKSAGMKTSEIDSSGKVRRVGDVIVGVDGRGVATPLELLQTLASHEIGQEVEISYLRDGKEHTTKVKLVGVE
jgi:S1-C subfamily serine protease